jgi:DnaK suppressor protein
MTRSDLAAFRRNLESVKTELGTRNRERCAIETSPEELDRIQNASERDYAIGDWERKSNREREVEAALRRIDAGTFGVCAGCEEDISPKRLAAVPWASLCIGCQETADRSAAGFRTGVDETSLVMPA